MEAEFVLSLFVVGMGIAYTALIGILTHRDEVAHQRGEV